MGLGNVDTVQIVLTILDDNWDTDVIAKPTIAKKDDWPSPSVASKTFVLGYPVTRNHAYADSYAQWQRVVAEIALDMRTRVDTDLNKVVSEVERILHVERVDPNAAFDLIDYAGIDHQENYKEFNRAVANVRLLAQCRSITGG